MVLQVDVEAFGGVEVEAALLAVVRALLLLLLVELVHAVTSHHKVSKNQKVQRKKEKHSPRDRHNIVALQVLMSGGECPQRLLDFIPEKK